MNNTRITLNLSILNQLAPYWYHLGFLSCCVSYDSVVISRNILQLFVISGKNKMFIERKCFIISAFKIPFFVNVILWYVFLSLQIINKVVKSGFIIHEKIATYWFSSPIPPLVLYMHTQYSTHVIFIYDKSGSAYVLPQKYTVSGFLSFLHFYSGTMARVSDEIKNHVPSDYFNVCIPLWWVPSVLWWVTLFFPAFTPEFLGDTEISHGYNSDSLPYNQI